MKGTIVCHCLFTLFMLVACVRAEGDNLKKEPHPFEGYLREFRELKGKDRFHLKESVLKSIQFLKNEQGSVREEEIEVNIGKSDRREETRRGGYALRYNLDSNGIHAIIIFFSKDGIVENVGLEKFEYKIPLVL